jgi:hypothetical protein
MEVNTLKRVADTRGEEERLVGNREVVRKIRTLR